MSRFPGFKRNLGLTERTEFYTTVDGPGFKRKLGLTERTEFFTIIDGPGFKRKLGLTERTEFFTIIDGPFRKNLVVKRLCVTSVNEGYRHGVSTAKIRDLVKIKETYQY